MIARVSLSALSSLQVRNIYECLMCMLVLHYFPLSSFLGLQHQDKSKESAWYWIMVLASHIATWIQGPLGKDAIGISYPAMGHRKNGWRRERRRPFSRFELFLEKTEWVLVIEEEHFVCFPSSEPLSAVQRLILRALTRTCVSFCFLFFLFELVNLSEDEPTDEMLIPSGKPFCIFLFYFCRNTETLV